MDKDRKSVPGFDMALYLDSMMLRETFAAALERATGMKLDFMSDMRVEFSRMSLGDNVVEYFPKGCDELVIAVKDPAQAAKIFHDVFTESRVNGVRIIRGLDSEHFDRTYVSVSLIPKFVFYFVQEDDMLDFENPEIR